MVIVPNRKGKERSAWESFRRRVALRCSRHRVRLRPSRPFLQGHAVHQRNRHRFHFADRITNRYPLADVNAALESMAALRDIKPAILPGLD